MKFANERPPADYALAAFKQSMSLRIALFNRTCLAGDELLSLDAMPEAQREAIFGAFETALKIYDKKAKK